MSQQTMKQRARRAAREVAERRRREQAERDKRIEVLAVQVMTALGERDAAVAAAERRAGLALREMTDVEGMTVAEAVEWCDEQVSVREATRLRQVVRCEERTEVADRSSRTASEDGWVGGSGVGAE